MATTKETEKIESIIVSFMRRLEPDGTISAVQIRQYASFLHLTPEQARSLARTLLAKLGDQ
jgi:hypothetical protein